MDARESIVHDFASLNRATSTTELDDDAILGPSYRYRPLPDHGQIRILLIAPASRLEDPIVCTLQAVKRDLSSNYKALSYSWGMDATGDASLCRYVTLDGVLKPITRNLYEGLRRIRSKDSVVRLWVDAVCIDQQDANERSEQVARMSKTFAQATSTIIWLGEGDLMEGIRASRALQRLRVSFQSNKIGDFCEEGVSAECHGSGFSGGCCYYQEKWSSPFRRTFDIEPAECKRAFQKSAFPILALVKRRYWRRRWIIQELMFARNREYYWGSSRGDLELLFTNDDAQELFRLEAYGFRNINFNTVSQVLTCRTMHITRALEICRRQDCFDRRDIIYSLVSVDDSLMLFPNYTLTYHEVCLQFAGEMYMRGSASWILRQIETVHREQSNDVGILPSWAIDLRTIQEIGVFESMTWLKVPYFKDSAMTCSVYVAGVFTRWDPGLNRIDGITWKMAYFVRGARNLQIACHVDIKLEPDDLLCTFYAVLADEAPYLVILRPDYAIGLRNDHRIIAVVDGHSYSVPSKTEHTSAKIAYWKKARIIEVNIV